MVSMATEGLCGAAGRGSQLMSYLIQCSQNLVNLLLVGRAATNVFDHDQNLGGISKLWCHTSSQVGVCGTYLSLLEPLGG